MKLLMYKNHYIYFEPSSWKWLVPFSMLCFYMYLLENNYECTEWAHLAVNPHLIIKKNVRLYTKDLLSKYIDLISTFIIAHWLSTALLNIFYLKQANRFYYFDPTVTCIYWCNKKKFNFNGAILEMISFNNDPKYLVLKKMPAP